MDDLIKELEALVAKVKDHEFSSFSKFGAGGEYEWRLLDHERLVDEFKGIVERY